MTRGLGTLLPFLAISAALHAGFMFQPMNLSGKVGRQGESRLVVSLGEPITPGTNSRPVPAGHPATKPETAAPAEPVVKEPAQKRLVEKPVQKPLPKLATAKVALLPKPEPRPLEKRSAVHRKVIREPERRPQRKPQPKKRAVKAKRSVQPLPERRGARKPKSASAGKPLPPGVRARQRGGKMTALQQYLQAVRMRIENKKFYPSTCLAHKREGVVLVELLIRRDGALASLRLKERTVHPALNRAALQTAREASPFPRFPKAINKEKLKVHVPLRFHVER